LRLPEVMRTGASLVVAPPIISPPPCKHSVPLFEI